MGKRPVARVLPDSRVPQLDRLFDYTIPEGMDVSVGCRVKAPMGRGERLHNGWVVDIVEDTVFSGTLAALDSVVSPVPVVTGELLDLAKRVATRGAGGVADVLRLAIPPRAARVEQAWLARDGHTEQPPGFDLVDTGYPDGAFGVLGHSGAKHWLGLPYGVESTGAGPIPRGHATVARLAQSVLATGRSVVVCLPDWRDVSAFQAYLEDTLDSQWWTRWDPSDSPSTRYQAYLRTRESQPVIAFGSRHSIYAPVSHLGLVIVVNDADDSHLEPLAPYPHSRDIALMRAEDTGCAVVFASLTPSLESLRLLSMGYLNAIRPSTDTRPRVIPTALGRTDNDPHTPARLPSLAFRGVNNSLKDGPVLVQVFHSGYSPGLVCGSCRERARCRQCGGPLTAPGPQGPVSCGWCGHIVGRWACSECSGTDFHPSGHGLGRTATELGKAFPGFPVVRSDGSHKVHRVTADPALIVATRGAEPIAEGGYRAVLLLDGEAMLQRPALDALEDTIMAWESALALLAPGQTGYLTDLEGQVAQAVAAGAIESLLSRELAERTALGMPPAVRIASLTGPRGAVQALVDACGALDGVSTVGTATSGPTVTTVIRFPYRVGKDVAELVRAGVVRNASQARRGSGRVKAVMDDVTALDALASQSQ